MPETLKNNLFRHQSPRGVFGEILLRKLWLRWITLPLFCCWFQTLAWGQSAVPAPARILTQYALTVTQDRPGRDPKSWRLQGSNDGGKSWTRLDAQTNQIFYTRSMRRIFEVSNQSAFNLYRLQIDQIDGASDFGMDMSAQLAEVELIGPFVKAENESKVQEIITASQAHPILGSAENAFDHDPMTRWRDYGLNTPGGCWIQCQYTYHSEQTITNIGEVQKFVYLATADDSLYDKEPQILSNLTAHTTPPLPVLTGYSLTSANDEPPRDPRTWRLLGSNDRGLTWQVLDTRANEIFDQRFQRREFVLTNPAVYATYRLEISALRQSGIMIQLGKLEPLYSQKTVAEALSLVVSANSDNPPIESCEMPFHGDPKNKWLSISTTDISADQPGWLQWQYIPKAENLPVISRSSLDKLANHLRLAAFLSRTNTIIRSLTGYALTSGNDFSERDPRDWRLLGSKDGGLHWDVLDVRQQETFGARKQQRVFMLPHPVAYPKYRLQIDSVADPGRAGCVQLAEIKPLGAAVDTDTNVCLVVSAQGENGARESVGHAFDQKPDTKWLDYAENHPNRASWIEWQYARNMGVPVFNLDQMNVAQLYRTAALRLSLSGTVVYRDPAINTIGLLDQTGFQIFQVPGCPSAQVGDQACLQGQLSCRHGQPVVLASNYTKSGTVPALGNIPAAAHLAPGLSLGLTTLEGTVTSISFGDSYATLSLSTPNHPHDQLVRVVGASQEPALLWLNCHLRARGIAQALFDPQDQPAANVLWVSGLDQLSLVAAEDQDWTAWRNYSRPGLARTNQPDSGVIRVQGTVTEHLRDNCLVLSNGTDCLEVHCLNATNWAPGSAIEAAGFLLHDGNQLVLVSALIRTNASQLPPANLAFKSVNNYQPAMLIGDVRNALRAHPQGSFPFQIRGVITYIDLALGEFYLQNGSASVCLQGQLNAGLSPFQHQEGNNVEIDGLAHAGQLYATSFARVLGPGCMPEPARPSWNDLMQGNHDGRWIELQGIISAVEKQRLTLAVGGDNIIVWVNDLGMSTHLPLLGTLADIAGVCSPVLNHRHQRVGFRLLVPSGEYIRVLNPVPENPFEQPTTPIAGILQTGSSGSSQPNQVVKSSGIVTYCEPNLMFIQDKLAGLRISLRSNYNVVPGDLVEVSGRAKPDGFSIKLIQTSLRQTGHGELPRARPINLSEINASGQEEALDAMRVQLNAVVLAQHFDGLMQTFLLQDDQTKQTFPAFIPVKTGPAVNLPSGSHVQLNGVFKAKRDIVDIDQAITAFELYVASPRDILVLDHLSWWTNQHSLWSLAGLAVVLLVALCWVYALRHQVHLRTVELNRQIERRQLLENQRVVEEERVRVAQDLHDELGTGLTELGLLGDLVKNPVVSAADKDHYLELLTCTSRSLVSSLDEIVWAVNPHNDSLASLASYCILFAQRFLDLARIACRPQFPQNLPEYSLDSKKRHDVFLVFKEALNNAVRHSGATEVRLKLSVVDAELSLTVVDNGRGFEFPQAEMPGMDGLRGMRNRMKQLGGSCHIQSQPGRGTEVTLRLYLERPLP